MQTEAGIEPLVFKVINSSTQVDYELTILALVWHLGFQCLPKGKLLGFIIISTEAVLPMAHFL